MSNDTDDLLEELLASSSSETPSAETEEAENKILQPLLNEINLIKDQSVRVFVRAVLLGSKSFWVIPSSFSGKYHPADEHSEGGNVIHTQRVVRTIELICKAQERTEFERDILLAAALLHDVTKGKEKSDGTTGYDPLHPYTVDKLINDLRERDDEKTEDNNESLSIYLEEEYVQQILRLIRCHLGVWSPIPETIPVTSLEWALHMADYFASKAHWILDGDTSRTD